MANYFFDESEDGYGRVFVPRGPWRPAYSDLVASERVKVVRLSASAGWTGGSLDFLRELHFLRGVEIYSWDVRDASIIGSLSELRLVGLDCDLRRSIDFTSLPHLEVLKATWKKKMMESVLHCRELKHVNVSNWPGEDLRALASMTKLTKLQLTSRKLASLSGISALSALESLDLYACPKLASLEELRLRVRIQNLEIASCRGVHDVSALGTLHALRNLAINNCGDVDTLTPLRGCRKLERLSFFGTTRVVDGELSFISDLPRLRELVFAPRRHYDRKRKELLGLGKQP